MNEGGGKYLRIGKNSLKWFELVLRTGVENFCKL